MCVCVFQGTLLNCEKKCIKIRGKGQMYFGNKDLDDRRERESQM